LVTGREWELNLRAHGNGIGNGNELMGMGGNGIVASHSRTSLIISYVYGLLLCQHLPTTSYWVTYNVFPHRNQTVDEDKKKKSDEHGNFVTKSESLKAVRWII